jgi:thiol-disulfide isomerase/thioredoxin
MVEIGRIRTCYDPICFNIMRKTIFIFFSLISVHALAQQATVIKFDRLSSLIDENKDRIHVINFWATWCGPCVKELPLLEALTAKDDPAIKVTLISLDFADEISKVNSFIGRKKIRSEVLLLDEIDYNEWIDRVDKSWGGAIPATLFINQKTGQRKFIDKELKDGDLEKVIVSLTNE